MLAPSDRQLLLDMIRPPAGYHFDSGIGTTFTLDLYTLLAVPLSLAMYDRDSLEEALLNPMVLLDSLRKNANRLAIFCQAGYIHVPARSHPLFHHLEKMIVQVQAPNGGLFHPKTWVLCYTAENKKPIFRLLNLSRNLTNDRSWDIALGLESLPDGKRGQNKPLVNFLAALPGMSSQTLPEHIQLMLASFIKSLPNVVFQAPKAFNPNIDFHPLGIRGHRESPLSNHFDRMMVISPFLSRDFLDKLTGVGENHVLVSRQESLDMLPAESISRFKQVYFLDQMAEPEDIENESESPFPKEQLSGLHAKLIITETGKQVEWLVGSANATDAAFNKNIEFTVALTGHCDNVGIDAVLGQDDQSDIFRKLLREYQLPENPELKDAEQLKAQKLTDDVRRWLVKNKFHLLVQSTDSGSFSMALESGQIENTPAGTFEICCFPVTLGDGYKQSISIGPGKLACKFNSLSLSALTSFIVFEVSALFGKATHSVAFVLNLPISGLPENRSDILLAEIIANKIQFLRYLRLLLADEGWQIDPNELLATGSGEGWQFNNSSPGWDDEMPLLEDLVRALSRSPQQKFERISDLIAQLKRTEAGQELIPMEFDALWSLLDQARQELL